MSATEHVLDHVYKLLFEELRLCGCGNPEDAYGLVREVLALAPFHEDPEAVHTLIGHPGACHFILSALTNVDLIEHAGRIGGSWLTPKGEWFREAMRAVEIDDLEREDANVGLPHDGGECTTACWRVPIAGAVT
uniref:Uncharacterized protein n=1 Tax=Streptomyces sp. NBC_00049 TaxID=2903617 RepID=A0AAU2K2E6_9ACTN